MRYRVAAFVVSIGLALTLGGCGPSEQQGSSASAAPMPSVPSSTQPTPVRASHYRAELALAGAPGVTNDGGDIAVPVDVTNDGEGTYGSTTTPHPVNLGAHSVGPDGKVINENLARAQLPQLASGRSARVTILLPTNRTLGHRAEILPVQEGVNWFDAWGTKPLIVGPFNACAGKATGRVCGADGKPLEPIPIAQTVPFHAVISLVGAPSIVDRGQRIALKVTVTNDGATGFGSSSQPHPINLGAHSVGDTGKVIDMNLARARLPQIPPGASAQVTILLPAAKAMTHKVEILPVEEGVNWFDVWGTRALLVGPFDACQTDAAKICGPDGERLQ